jgi:arylformamidase
LALVTNDEAYQNMPFIPAGESYPPRWEAAAAAWRETATWRTIRYGDAAREELDLYLPDDGAVGLVVFVHGGYWRAFDRRTFSHLAAGAAAAGWAVAMPSYTLVPEARISQITRQVARAIDAAGSEVPGPIRLSGHSAGGHLVARMLMSDVDLGVSERLAGCVPISPLGDLRPLIDTEMNADFRLDEAEAEAESPALHRRACEVPVTVWVGAEERPAFVDQARWLAEAWDVDLVVEPGRHHFDVIEALTHPDTPLTRAVLGTH